MLFSPTLAILGTQINLRKNYSSINEKVGHKGLRHINCYTNFSFVLPDLIILKDIFGRNGNPRDDSKVV